MYFLFFCISSLEPEERGRGKQINKKKREDKKNQSTKRGGGGGLCPISTRKREEGGNPIVGFLSQKGEQGKTERGEIKKRENGGKTSLSKCKKKTPALHSPTSGTRSVHTAGEGGSDIHL